MEVNLHPNGVLSEKAIQEATSYLQEGYQVKEYLNGRLRFATHEEIPELPSTWKRYKQKRWEKRLLKKDAVYQITAAMYMKFEQELPPLLQPYKRINAERMLHKFGMFTFFDKKIERKLKRREKQIAKRKKQESKLTKKGKVIA